MKKIKHYDYIVIGAGSAGAIVASRLSEDPNCTVLLVEYGGSDRSIFIRMPLSNQPRISHIFLAVENFFNFFNFTAKMLFAKMGFITLD